MRWSLLKTIHSQQVIGLFSVQMKFIKHSWSCLFCYQPIHHQNLDMIFVENGKTVIEESYPLSKLICNLKIPLVIFSDVNLSWVIVRVGTSHIVTRSQNPFASNHLTFDESATINSQFCTVFYCLLQNVLQNHPGPELRSFLWKTFFDFNVIFIFFHLFKQIDIFYCDIR